ncbi:MAG: alkaline phosphatase family protein [Planctomycetes bacterium]|nr:alkaline phosphatase family protein [Planctomycetota bacterium]
MNNYLLRSLTALLLACCGAGQAIGQTASPATPAQKTTNVILITLDGLRWQDVFTGADNRMLNKEHGGVADLLAMRKRFWRSTPEQRREVLMPFLWTTIQKEGQIFGDPEHDARAVVTNPHRFSYPGYSELLCGFADPRIDSNNKMPNPNVSVLEWLQGRPGFAGRIAAFSGWDVHPFILNATRSQLFVESAFAPVTVARTPERLAQLQATLDHLPRYWEGFAWDAATFARAKEYWLVKKPRVLYLALGETDEWGHGRRYDLYLQMAHSADAMIRDLWELAQQDDQYRGRTSLVITVDHGRGRTEKDWTDHGAKVDGAEEVWMAVLGPDTPPLGVRQGVQATQAMVASTVAALLGEDFRQAVPAAAGPLPGAVR